MAAKRKWEDDDGRVIADMSDVSRPGMFFPQKTKKETHTSHGEEHEAEKKPWETGDVLTPGERRMYILGALKAALLIALAFIAGLGAVVAVMLMLWT